MAKNSASLMPGPSIPASAEVRFPSPDIIAEQNEFTEMEELYTDDDANDVVD